MADEGRDDELIERGAGEEATGVPETEAEREARERPASETPGAPNGG